MIDYKTRHNLIGEENWPYLPSVLVKGVEGQKQVLASTSDKESVVKTWDNVAVLEISSDEEVDFYLGFATAGTIQYLKHEFRTNISLGVRIGGDDTLFFVLPKDLEKTLEIKYLKTVKENNSKYKDLILI